MNSVGWMGGWWVCNVCDECVTCVFGRGGGGERERDSDERV